MNLDDDDDSVFERALRADLPTLAEQNRMRQRILAAGIAAGAALGTSNVAASATQASFGASALVKLSAKASALSWPAKLGVAAVLAAPIAALPLVDAPVRGAALVSQVRSSATSLRARPATKAALSPANSLPLEAAQAAPIAQAAPLTQPAPIAQPAPLTQPAPLARPAPLAQPGPTTQTEPTLEPVPANAAARALAPDTSNPMRSAPSPGANLPTSGNLGASEPAVAAFDSIAHGAAANESERLRNDSTLAAETQLLDRAFAALAVGDRGTATALVAEHARRFPNGLLRQERERARSRLAPDPKGK